MEILIDIVLIYNQDRLSGKQMGQYLVDNHFIHRVDGKWSFLDDNSLYKIIDRVPKGVLNDGPLTDCKALRG